MASMSNTLFLKVYTVDFLFYLKDRNYYTSEPVKKVIILECYKNFVTEQIVKKKWIQVFRTMNVIRVLKKPENGKKDIIVFVLKDLDVLKNNFINKANKAQNSAIKNPVVAPKQFVQLTYDLVLDRGQLNLRFFPIILNTQQNQNQTSTPEVDSGRALSLPNSEQSAPLIETSTSSGISSSNKKTKRIFYVNQDIAIPTEKLKKPLIFSPQSCQLCEINFRGNLEYSHHQLSMEHMIREQYRTQNPPIKKKIKGLKVKWICNNKSSKQLKSEVNVSNKVVCEIKNLSTKYNFEVLKMVLLNNSLQGLHIDYTVPYLITSKQVYNITIEFKFEFEGCYLLPMVLLFNSEKLGFKKLLLELPIFIESELVRDLKPVAPYKKKVKTVTYSQKLNIVDKRKDNKHNLKIVYGLKNYAMSLTMIHIINSGFNPNALVTFQEKSVFEFLYNLLNVPVRKNCLNEENYVDMLRTLLYFEEHQLLQSVTDYNCKDKKLHVIPKSKLLSLEIPNLAECRPSLCTGDRLNVKPNNKNVHYRGYIKKIGNDYIQIEFDEKFLKEIYNEDLLFSVEFSLNRYSLKIQHQAIELIKKHDVVQYFFPKEVPSPQFFYYNLEWFQPCLVNNFEQQQAVQHIVSGSSTINPYLLFGPPGTGKTTTIVEAVLQLLKLDLNIYILITAPSNSCVDEITERLLPFVNSEVTIFRMYASYYEVDNISPQFKEITNIVNNDVIYPTIAEIEKYRVVLTTLSAAAKLVNGGLLANHFSHVFIDECGHATEPEALISIAGILTSMEEPNTFVGNLILVGDPKQLGPVLYSKLAKEYGFDTSILERLMTNCEIYQKQNGKYNSKLVTKLIRNFRSHPAILKLPNELFYDNELLSCAGNFINFAINWSVLPNKNIPMIFHSVKGKEQRESNSPSYFNCQEIDVVMKYLSQLVNAELPGGIVTQDKIGIVTPYAKQVYKLQLACAKKGWNDILIGSVDKFQGREKLIILISTVRSTQKLVHIDYQYHLGFLKNAKRFNVAMTRAKALVIIIGNPDVLLWDENWGKLIKFCYENHALAGSGFLFKEYWWENQDTVDSILPRNFLKF